jgi:hypothetical protein
MMDDLSVIEALRLFSLPVAEAVPEITRLDWVVAITTEVESIAHFTRIGNDASDPRKGKRPALISVRIDKKPFYDDLGIDFRSVFGELVIGSIAPTSPLMTSPIRPGDRLISLDHHQKISHWTAAQAANCLRSQNGFVSIVVETKDGDSNVAEACVYKPIPEFKLGVSFQSENGRLRVRNVTNQGLLGAMSVLQAGDYVESINYMPVQEIDEIVAYEIVRDIIGLVSLRVKRNYVPEVSLLDIMRTNQLVSLRYSENPIVADELDFVESNHSIPTDPEFLARPGFISVVVQRPTADTRIAISFANPDGDGLIISDIGSQSLFSNSPLVAGCVVHSINDVPCLRYSKDEAQDLIDSQFGEIRLVAQDPAGDASYAVGMAFKPTPQASLGLAFNSVGGSLSLTRLHNYGLFSSSVLNNGDKVIAINKIPCQHMQPRDAVIITQTNSEAATILVRLSRRKGVVLSQTSVAPPNRIRRWRLWRK